MESSEDHTQPAVRVYTLGRFRVEVDAVPVDVEGRRHHRPWQLLKLLIALGGDSVQETQLVEALWLVR